jgi:hypothetical protein
MHCKCGYDFAKAALKSIQEGCEKYESYAAIGDEDYRKFIKLESKALAAADKKAKLKFIARSAEFAGVVSICPNCSRLHFIKPKTFELVRYVKENE